MRVFRHYQNIPADARGAVVAIGNFDGVHLGHRAVIGEAGAIAHATARPWGVLTFEPHPRAFFAPDTPPFRLTPFHAKARQIFGLGVDSIFVQQFNRAFSSLTAEQFIETVLVQGLGARHVVCGYDFVFGKGRGGKGRGKSAFAAGVAKKDGGRPFGRRFDQRWRHQLAAATCGDTFIHWPSRPPYVC